MLKVNLPSVAAQLFQDRDINHGASLPLPTRKKGNLKHEKSFIYRQKMLKVFKR